MSGLTLAAAAALLLLGGAYGVRAGWWPYPVGFGLIALSLLLAMAAIALLLVNAPSSAPAATLAGLALAATVVIVPARFVAGAWGLPAIHDISTDLADPPVFERALMLRGASANPVLPPDGLRVRRQRAAYPDIAPLAVAAAPPAAFVAVEAAARALGWDVIAADPSRGMVEAVAATQWFGFRDDVVVRIRPADGGSRIDVRSVSRVGVGDAGTNARRIRTFAETVRTALE